VETRPDVDGFNRDIATAPRSFNRKGCNWFSRIAPEAQMILLKIRSEYHAGNVYVSKQQIWTSARKNLKVDCSLSSFRGWFNEPLNNPTD